MIKPIRKLWHWLTDADIKTGTRVPEESAWRQRYSVIGRFQARYLFLLLLFGVFFIALDQQITSFPMCLEPESIPESSRDDCSISVPVVNLQLSVVYVWMWGAPVLLILLLAVFGSLRAALKAKVLSGLEHIEPYDEHPNLIDMAVYSYPDVKGPLRTVGVLSYLLYLTVFWVEALYLVSRLYASDPLPRLASVAIGITAFLAVWSVPPLLKMWVKRVHGLFKREN